MRLWRNWQTRTVQVRVMNSHEGSNPSNRTNEEPRNLLILRFFHFCDFFLHIYNSAGDDHTESPALYTTSYIYFIIILCSGLTGGSGDAVLLSQPGV